MKNHEKKLQTMFTSVQVRFSYTLLGLFFNKVVLLNDNMFDNLHYSLESYLGLAH